MSDKLTLNELKVLSTLLVGEKYGLEITKSMEEEMDIKFSLGTIYNLLYRMEEEGYIKSKRGEATSVRGGNRRKYYKLTGLGQTVVKQEIQSLMKIVPNLNPIPTVA